MKKTFSHLLRCGLLLALCYGPASSAEVMREISVCWEEGLKPPYLMLDKSNRVTGIAADMIDDILRRQNIKARHHVRPWKRCLAEIESGVVDLVPNSSFQEERTRYALFSAPLYETHLVLFYKRSRFAVQPKITGIDDLRKHKVGGILGFNYDQYGGQLPIETSATSRQSLMRMLDADRYDFAIEQLEIVRMMAARNEISLSGISHIPDPIAPIKAFHVLVSKRHPDAARLKRIVDDGIAAQQRDGTSRKISARYLGAGDLQSE